MRATAVTFAVLSLGCASEPTAPSIDLATTRSREIQEFVSEAFQISECAGEAVEIHFIERVTSKDQTLPGGKSRQQITVKEIGSSAVGLETGRHWTVKGNQAFTFTSQSALDPDGLIRGTSTTRAHTRLTLRGTPTLRLRVLFTMIQAEVFDPVTGEGDVTIIKDSFRQRVTGCDR